MIIADTSVLIDVVKDNPVWGLRSRVALDAAAANDEIVYNDIIYAEFSARYPTIEEFETVLAAVPLKHKAMPRQALFLAAKAFQLYRRRGATKTGVLSDFFIGAHAAVEGAALLTRDPGHVRTYFPTVTLIGP